MLLFSVFLLLLWSQVANAEGVMKSDQDKPDLCLLPPKVGKCKARLERYYYDDETKECTLFYYGGCDANENNFEKKEDCEKRCGDTGKLVCPPVPVGKSGACVESCGDGCTGGQLCCSNGCGHSCMDGIKKPIPRTPLLGCPPVIGKGSCKVEKCGVIDGQPKCPEGQLCCYNGCTYTCVEGVATEKPEICYMPAKVGKCKAKIEKYYFDAEMNECTLFYYGGCDANENNFDTKEDCEKRCSGSVHIDICNLP
ncbi:unnamed protein product, partial [Owenia fusiformis]